MSAEPYEQLYTLTVPGTLDSLAVIEGLCETFITESVRLSEDEALVLRLSVAEACRNALTQRPAGERLNVVSLTFLRRQEEVALEITDPGPGLEIEGCFPPYPEAMTGSVVSVAEVLGQRVRGSIVSPMQVELNLEEMTPAHPEETREVLLARTEVEGLWLIALTRCWRRVRFTYDGESGNRLRLEEPV